MKCKICNQENKSIFNGIILNKYDIQYYHCSKCNFMQTEEPYWIAEAYSESINIQDTGYIHRNLLFSSKLTILLSLFFNKQGVFLDYAGGYGVFVRLMRDIGFDFCWDDKFTQNMFVKGFEYDSLIKIEAITTFESFEHFVEPLDEIEKMLSISKNIIFSTELLPSNVPKTEDWWYYGIAHGQHISFYSIKTFEFIAKKYDLKYINLGNLHILTEKQISKFKLQILKFTRLGLHKYLQKKLKSKTWDDYLKMSKLP